MTGHPRIELLAPAGDAGALRAALGAGADAVYFGLERWSARAFAGNFAGGEAVRAVELAHLYDARAHLALNTLLKDDEFEPALSALEAPYAAGLDALIVADLGFAALVRERYPELELHASTQLNTHSSGQLAVLSRLGFARAIIARELSLDEIAALEGQGIALEAFVHGALCYGYSGDCLLSSMVGGRSGNRGRCSQSCRMRYRLRRAPADGRDPVRHDAGFDRVLSTGDLCALGALPALLACGVTSFKIEGRMKDASYVAVTTKVYREALDVALADPEGYVVRPEWLACLEQSFSRGFTAAHLEGRLDEMRSGGRGGHRGVLVGRVASVDEGGGEAVVRLSRPVAAGDVVYLYTPWGQTDTMRVAVAATAELTLRVRERVAVKDRLFRLSVAETGELAHELASGRRVERPVRLHARLEGGRGEAARLTLRALPDGPTAVVASAQPLAPARAVVLDERRARDALGALGGTPYALAGLDLAVEPGLFLPVGALKDLRRRAVAALDERRLDARRRRETGRRLVSAGSFGAASPPMAMPRGPGPDEAGRRASGCDARVGLDDDASRGLDVVRRGPDEDARRGLDDGRRGPAPAASAWRPRDARDVVLVVRPEEAPVLSPDSCAVCLDLHVRDPIDEVARALAGLERTGLPGRCRLPEVLFDADRDWLAAVITLPWAAVHVRHLTALVAAPPGAPLVLEYPLQGLNSAGAVVLAGLAERSQVTVVASPEAALSEIAALHEIAAPSEVTTPAVGNARLHWPPTVEILAFGRVQVVHTRDRLGRAEGLVDAPDPATHVALMLEDAKGYAFPAEVDAGGTRLFNARVTNLAANLDELRAAGVARFHVVQRDLSPREGRAFASGGLPALAAFVSRERTTTGHLFRGVT